MCLLAVLSTTICCQLTTENPSIQQEMGTRYEYSPANLISETIDKQSLILRITQPALGQMNVLKNWRKMHSRRLKFTKNFPNGEIQPLVLVASFN
jgi:hypothetical protein